jgi:hypothetical protein
MSTKWLVVVQLRRPRGEDARVVQDQKPRGGSCFLRRRQGRLASGGYLTPDRTRIRDLLQLLLEDYDVRGVA